jgi:hypothetical protein
MISRLFRTSFPIISQSGYCATYKKHILSFSELGGYLGLFLGVSVFDLKVLMDFLPAGQRK